MKIDIKKLVFYILITIGIGSLPALFVDFNKYKDILKPPFSPPGFIFPISGLAEYSFNETPYISEVGTIIHGGANMDLRKQVIGEHRCENIVVLYDVNYLSKDSLNLHDLHFKLDIRKNTNLISLLWKLKNISEEKHEIARFKRQNIFRAILEEIFTSVQDP